MKMSKEDFAILKGIIEPIMKEVSFEKYKAEGLSPMRYRWDLFWVAQRRSNMRLGIRLYDKGLNDDHIDTALRKITGTK